MLKKLFTAFLALSFCLALVVTPAVAGDAGQVSVQDNELVVVGLGADSSISGIQVLDHLRMTGTGSAQVEDQSAFGLASARNLYSSEKPVIKDGKVVFNTSVNGVKDIYYLAKLADSEISKVKLPVAIKVEYFLDGQQVKPQEIAGKTGHLKIVTTMENLTGKETTLEFTDKAGNKMSKTTTIFTPYVVSLSGWQFPNKMFKNVKAPGVAGESPEGVIVDVKGVTQVTWSVPLVPPKYPAKQYATLEADGINMELPAFQIAVLPVAPTTSEVDSISAVTQGFTQLRDGFKAINTGVGSKDQVNTLLWGFGQVIPGMDVVSGGLGKLVKAGITLRMGLSNPKFDIESWNGSTDKNGNTPGLKEALTLAKKAEDAQTMVLALFQTAVGSPADSGKTPALTTSAFNDLNVLKEQCAGNAAALGTIGIMQVKLAAMSNNLKVMQDGGKLISSAGQVDFPANTKTVSSALAKSINGIDMMVAGVGDVKADGTPVPVYKDGQPGSLLFALAAMKQGIDGQVKPGLAKMESGVSQIGSGAGEAVKQLDSKLVDLNSYSVLPAALGKSAEEANAATFLGKPEGASATVAYVFQTPAATKSGGAMTTGLISLVVLFVLLVILTRKPSAKVEASA